MKKMTQTKLVTLNLTVALAASVIAACGNQKNPVGDDLTKIRSQGKTIQEMGLDINKDYKVFYTSNNIKQVQRGTSPDYLEILEDKYDILDNNNWFKINGWNGFLCIKQI